MGWMPLYLIREDVQQLNDLLNNEEEIAFLISNGKGKWIAEKEHDINTDLDFEIFDGDSIYMKRDFVEYNLWHIPSGSLPLYNHRDFHSKIINPWEGWTENQAGANPNVPYFGSGHPGIISLTIQLERNNYIAISDFGWIGNHYKIIGREAEKSTELFWNKLKRNIKKIAIQIPRCNDLTRKKEIFAFPFAYDKIKNGQACSLN